MIYNNKIEVKLFSIKQLKSLFDKKIFAVPKLQRDFVWNSKKAADLMDSIYKTYPIGTILIWKARKSKQFELNHHPSALPQYRAKGNKFIFFIIDGQQRLSVLNRILKGDIIKNYRNEEIDFGKIFFLLSSDDKKFKYLKYERTDTASLYEILSPYWKSKFYGAPGYIIKSMNQCRERVFNYKVPFLMVSGYDLKEIKQTFIRINSLGTPISSADQAFTLASSFNLKDKIKLIFQNFNSGFINLPKEAILRTIVLIWGIETKSRSDKTDTLQFGMDEINSLSRKLDSNVNAQKKFNKIWGILQYSFGLAIDLFMMEFKLRDYNDIPSENMLLSLATFFYYNNNAQPSSYERKQIRKWFWYTGVNSRYSGRGYVKNIIKDFLYFKKLGQGRGISYVISDKLTKFEIINSDYSSSSSINKAFFISLMLNEPKYLENGSNIPLSNYVSLKNKTNKHHIFPRDFLKRRNVGKNKINSLANICLLVFKENLDIRNNPPVTYLSDFKRKKYFNKFLRSHLIPTETNSGLYDKTKSSYQKFLDKRANLILKNFEKLAGTKLFER